MPFFLFDPDTPAQPDFRNAYQTQLVLDAILQSAKRGQWVHVKK
jgi:predicted dehydrogenase